MIWINRKGKPAVLVHPVSNFPTTILIAAGTGDIYLQRWREGEARGDPKRRCWNRHTDVWSAYRGLRLAQAKATIKRLPQLQELHAECAKVHGLLAGPERSEPTTLETVREFALGFLGQIVRPQTHALREARDQIERVAELRDALGRRNPIVLATRLVKVKERSLPERIQDIIGWLGHYLHREHDLSLLLRLAGGLLPQLEREVLDWSARLAANGTDGNQLLNLGREVACSARFVAQLQPFGGWINWARSCASDFDQAQRALVRGRRDDAILPLRRLLQSVKIKGLQPRISGLLLDVQLGFITGQPTADGYRRCIQELLEDSRTLDDDHLRKPILPKVTKHLLVAKNILQVLPSERVALETLCDNLRTACNLL